MDIYVILGICFGYAGSLLGCGTLVWHIASKAFANRIEVAEKRAEEYKTKADCVPELEKTIIELQNKLAEYNHKSQFNFNTRSGLYEYNGLFWCPVCFAKELETPLQRRNDGSRYCCVCGRVF